MKKIEKIFLSINDLEAKSIEKVALANGIEVVDLAIPWGGSLQMQDVSSHIIHEVEQAGVWVLCELPSRDVENQLRELGIQFCIIDHHIVFDNGDMLDRRNIRSSLSQFLDLIFDYHGSVEESGLSSFDIEKIIRNDTDFWYGLSRITNVDGEHIWLKEVLDIRLQDLVLQAKFGDTSNMQTTHDQLDKIIQGIGFLSTNSEAVRYLGDKKGPQKVLLIDEVRLHEEATMGVDPRYLREAACLIDSIKCAEELKAILQLAVKKQWDQLKKKLLEENVKITPVQLQVLSVSEAGLFFSSLGSRWSLFTEILNRENSLAAKYPNLKFYAGGGKESAYLGAFSKPTGIRIAGEVYHLVDELISESMFDVVPLLKWRARFIQTLDYSGLLSEPQVTEQVRKRFVPGLLDDFEIDSKTKAAKSKKSQDKDRDYFLSPLRPFLVPGRSKSGSGTVKDISVIDNVDPKSGESENEEAIPWMNSAEIDKDDLRVRSYTLKTDKSVFTDTINFVVQDKKPEPEASDKTLRKLKIASVVVHFLYDGLVMIDWSFEDEAGPIGDKGRKSQGALWRRVMASSANDIEELSLTDFLEIMEIARKTYSDYDNPDQQDELYIFSENEPQNYHSLRKAMGLESPHDGWFKSFLMEVLAPFWLDDSKGISLENQKSTLFEEFRKLELMWDSRGRALTSMVLDTEQPSTLFGQNYFKELRSNVLHIDKWSGSRFYSKETSEKEVREAAYDRFLESGSSYTISDNNFAFIGFGSGVIAYGWVPMDRMYRRMYMLVLEYSAVITKLSRELSSQQFAKLNDDISSEVIKTKLNRIENLQKRFTKFANGLWYERVSSLVQGDELFNLIVKQVDIKREYDELSAELEREGVLSDLLHQRLRQHQADRRETLTSALQYLVVPFGIFTTLIALMMQSYEAKIGWIANSLSALGIKLEGSVSLVIGFVFAFAVAVFWYFCSHRLIQKVAELKKSKKEK